MSYARFMEGDIYVYYHMYRYYVCCSCKLTPVEIDNERHYFDDVKFYMTQDIIDHVKEHIATGHKVPSRTIPQLLEDIGEDDSDDIRDLSCEDMLDD